MKNTQELMTVLKVQKQKVLRQKMKKYLHKTQLMIKQINQYNLFSNHKIYNQTKHILNF